MSFSTDKLIKPCHKTKRVKLNSKSRRNRLLCGSAYHIGLYSAIMASNNRATEFQLHRIICHRSSARQCCKGHVTLYGKKPIGLISPSQQPIPFTSVYSSHLWGNSPQKVQLPPKFFELDLSFCLFQCDSATRIFNSPQCRGE
jgi:hypothetical protein